MCILRDEDGRPPKRVEGTKKLHLYLYCMCKVSFIIKPTRCTNFMKLFWHEILNVSDSSSVHHQEFIHCTLSNDICHIAEAVYKPVWHIPLLSVQWINSCWWTDELSETCRVSCQNKFVKLVHLVGFIIKEICYDARSHERRSISLKVVFGKTQADGQCPRGQSCSMSSTATSKAIKT